MTALDFPNSPTNGEIFTISNKSWQWNGSVWQSVNIQEIIYDGGDIDGHTGIDGGGPSTISWTTTLDAGTI